MKLKMSKNSLFAILLRSPWWISMVLVAVFALASGALLPAPYVPFGVMGALPFFVIGIIAAWRQWHAPSPARVAEALGRAGAMSWRDFASAIEQAFGRQGYAVTRLNSAAADFRLVKGERITLVSGKRWKAASHGVDALRDLVAAQAAQGAHQSIYISLGEVTDNARRFAQAQGIELISGNGLAQLISDKNSL
ncbi:restriction endonuclease [Rhodoferax sp.]|uniref:restriction endonuclease n=1 Tax=Rhodoferax sp. TaxID=50421 RepID=UPI00271A346F|nr:restriction endonuclease [Rhodoferax sp.]MDO9198117.1 restriction endonuclease [Rhodoferax sp.]